MKIAKVTTIYLMLCLSGCISTSINTGELYLSSNSTIRDSKSIIYELEKSYEFSIATYVIIDNQTGSDENESTENLKKLLDKMNEYSDEYATLIDEISSSLSEINGNILGRYSVITESDIHYNTVKDYNEELKFRKKQLEKLKSDFYQAKAEFDDDVETRFNKYKAYVPSLHSQVRNIVYNYNAKQNYIIYNKKLSEIILARIESSPNDFISLLKLLDFRDIAEPLREKYAPLPANSYFIDLDTLNTLKTAALRKINRFIVSAAKDYVDSVKSLDEAIRKLKPKLHSQYMNVSNKIEREKHREVSSLFVNRIDELLNDKLSSHYNDVLNASRLNISDIEKLKRLNTLNLEFIKNNQEIVSLDSESLNRDVKSAYTTQFRVYAITGNTLKRTKAIRESLIEKIAPDILLSIEAAKKYSDIKNPFGDIISGFDFFLPVSRNIHDAIEKKVFGIINETSSSVEENRFYVNLESKGLEFSNEFWALYSGDFSNPFVKNMSSLTKSLMLTEYVRAYGRYCSNNQSSRKIPVSVQKCTVDNVTYDSWNNEVGRRCVNTSSFFSGIYANPQFSRVMPNTKVDQMRAIAGDTFGDGWLQEFYLIEDGEKINGLKNKLTLESEFKELMGSIHCNSKSIERFENNLISFSANEQPSNLSPENTLTNRIKALTPKFNLYEVNFEKLFNDLLLEVDKDFNLSDFRTNIAKPANASNVRVIRKDGADLPVKVTAYYKALYGEPLDSATFTFQDNIPQCVYIARHPQWCLQPSRSIINSYLHGRYLYRIKEE